MDLFTDQAFFRAFHILFGIAWIGLLYYFNFVQTEYVKVADPDAKADVCLLYTSPSPRDRTRSRMPSSA